MAQPTVQIDYAVIEEAVQALLEKAETVQEQTNAIDDAVNVLRYGGWYAQGADAFYDEMDSAIFPALSRLHDALHETATALHKISVTLQEAEEEALACFVGEAAPPPPPPAPPAPPAPPPAEDDDSLLWTIGELGVSILWEPADWFFTARDVINGDYYALVGLIPFVPSRAGKLLKGGAEYADEAIDVGRRADDIGDAARQGDKVADAAKTAGRARDAQGRMANIHNADYKRARQQYLESLANDPSKPAHVRGWVQQELNRLNKPPRASDWLSRTSDTEAAIRAKRAQRAQYRGSRASKKLDYESPGIRQPQGYDVGHIDNQLPIDEVNRPGNFQLENSDMNRSKGARHKR